MFDNLDKPSNLDGMVNVSKPKISSSDNNSNEAKFFTGEKLYGILLLKDIPIAFLY